MARRAPAMDSSQGPAVGVSVDSSVAHRERAGLAALVGLHDDRARVAGPGGGVTQPDGPVTDAGRRAGDNQSRGPWDRREAAVGVHLVRRDDGAELVPGADDLEVTGFPPRAADGDGV